MKNFLKVSSGVTTDDILIQNLIKAARQQAEILTDSVLVRSTFVQYMDHFPYWRIRERGYYVGQVGYAYEHHNAHRGEIRLRRTPLISVQSLVYIGADGEPHTLNPGQDFVVDGAQQPGRIRPIPYTVWPLTLSVPNAIAISFTAGYAPDSEGVAAGQAAITEPETVSHDLNPSWQPSTAVPQWTFLVDPNGNIEVQINAGSPLTGAGPNPPAWPAIGAEVVDGACLFHNYGPLRGFWTPDTKYSGNWIILDQNSNLQLLVIPSLISQTSPPSGIVGSVTPPFASEVAAITVDNGENAWRCLGAYRGLGNQGASIPTAPEQQAAYTIDWTLPDTVSMAIMQLVSHWYFNREPVVPGSVSEIPLHISSLLATVAVPDYAPTPDN